MALACEAVLFFDPTKATSLPYQRKRSGHTLSKGRFLGAQMAAYLENGHWLDLARANGHARRLAAGLAKIPGIRMPWPCEANEIFAILPGKIDAALKAGSPAGRKRRFATLPSDVDSFLTLARSAGGERI